MSAPSQTIWPGHLNRDIREVPSPTSTRSGLDLAHALGWANEGVDTREIRRGTTRLDVARGFVGRQPAALFAVVSHRNGFDPLDSAALYAYHATISWGLLADQRGLTVFNSHWIIDDDWFQLPRISWDEVAQRIEVLEGLTPGGLADGAIERLAFRQKKPSGFLQPVDDELVERLDNWRDQALRYARDAGSTDACLQTLYAQLFVLRTVEDRKLDNVVPALATILEGSEKVDWNAWKYLIAAARKRIGSDLFDNDVATDIPEHVFAGVVRDLYHPQKLPHASARYDFSWIEADVLGLAYEKYLATVLQPAPLAPQIELFLRPEREVERVTVRKKSGAYYTPKFIRDYLAASCVDEFFTHSDANKPPSVIDFACGSGSFLVAAVDQILKHLKAQDPSRHWARELVSGGFIVGIDVDANAVTTARLHLWQRLVQEPDALPLPNLSDVVVVADGLKRETWGHLNKPYDIVLGNPPFLATSLISDRDALEAKFKTARGRYDFSYLFIEQALDVLGPGGHLGMVVPNRIYRNRNGTVIRELLANQTDLLTLVDFGSTRPFDADAYVGCMVARTRPSGTKPPDRVRIIEVRSIEPSFLAALLLQAAQGIEEITSDAVHAYFAKHPSSGAPWTLLSENEQRSLILIEDVSVRLDKIAGIPQGIRTGGNDLFIFEIESSDRAHLCKAVNGLGESAVLEVELLEAVVYGSEVQRYELVQPTKRLLYPYRHNLVLPESELETRFPNVWAYFLRNRDLLAARASLRKSGGKWYELVWPRDETWLRRPKLLIRDLAPRTAFALDQRGNTFIVGGTAVVPEQPDLIMPLLAYLNSSVIDAIVRRTTPQFRGAFQKFEPQHIQGIPILSSIVEDVALGSQLGFLAGEVISARAKGAEAEAHEIETQINNMIREIAQSHGIRFNE